MRKLVLMAMAALPVLGVAQEEFTVSGKVASLSDPAKAYLSYRTDSGATLDSVALGNGEFKFHGTVDVPVRAMLLLLHEGGDIRQSQDPDRIELYLEKGHIKVSAKDSLVNAKVEGGRINTDFASYRLLSKGPENKMKALNSRYLEASDEQRQSPEFMSPLQEEAMAIQEEQQDIDLNFIKGNAGSLISLDLLQRYVVSEPVEEIGVLFDALDANLRESEKGKTVATLMDNQRKVAIGAVAPEFSQADTAGNQLSLSSLRGKYVLIDFWASWCGPCRRENPNVVEAYNKFKDRNFTVLGVSLDRPDAKDAWIQAIHDDGLQDWPHVSDLKFWNNEVAQLYAVRSIPTNFLLDPEGKIIARNLREEELHEVLEETLN